MSQHSSSTPRGWDAAESPFHAAELLVQQHVGVNEEAESIGRRGIRRHMPDQHRQFYAEQPFMVFGGLDANGQPWATLRAAEPGFVSSPDPRTLRIDGGVLPGDPLAGYWQPGMMIGGLGLQAQTRRRNRVNGVVSSVDGDTVTLEVMQSFGNCAKYIQSRTPTFVARGATGTQTPVETSTQLSAADRALLANADTFFIASANVSEDAGPARGADVSHRGGMPGFVRIDDATTLTTPDFSGNRLFNTLGNLLHDPRAGLLFVDFASGDMLYVAALAEIVWDGPELVEFPLAERLVRFRITEVRRSRQALPFHWSEVGYAPQFVTPASLAASVPAPLPASLPDPLSASPLDFLPASTLESPWKKLRISAVHEETPMIRSFYFESTDGSPLPAYEPGQYLPIRVPIDGLDKPLTRTYTLSDGSNRRQYRITVKRDGVGSAWLHDRFAAGMQIEAMAPRGAFTYDSASLRPAVFISAGIGITPMITMLHHAIAAREPLSPPRPLHFFHGARRDVDRPFSAHLQDLASRHPAVSMHLFDSATDPATHAPSGTLPGRVTLAEIKRALPFDDYDFYLCGPESFMRELYEGLRALNVADNRIRFEAFGPATIKRTQATPPAVAENAQSSRPAHVPASDGAAIPVTFARSQRTVQWLPENGTLLDLAEACGIAAPSSCRSGICGTCSTRVLNGRVAYEEPTDAPIDAGHALICMGRPVADDVAAKDGLSLEL
ncbi:MULTISPECIES: pyridoxamine 5'-phosphate oxidase family protein [Paraburkholderia]|uniref:Pyridoxamine 5'-phosphate oxidase family protein n=1 Tax=Paraburkholderia madseniana TaxID=2599607 RepID=A0AAP5BGL0_9BURK|nr:MULTISPECIES: pyridoxamine 5'-phosphate oxidase family protein [Paraburkholderia]MCX4149136.1 pyridoxamine 5'-phosphate oxidase family protein [Paraburkholderia madseniana]MDN7152073.1 pyridoxamine 5'-phosphate oxidase family protein [Paraburkholderia sp. WS6]MDQ6410953.1 pyridoxamine 5'-phosphate oxidase family protein [Paraburkholderia madseniana]